MPLSRPKISVHHYETVAEKLVARGSDISLGLPICETRGCFGVLGFVCCAPCGSTGRCREHSGMTQTLFHLC